MPLNKISVFISFLIISTITTISFAQAEADTISLAELKKATPPKTPTSAEIMRTRISKAKAYLVVKNYGAAVYELENIQRETGDKTVHRVLNVLLMHAYLEQGDYIKAQKFLKELHQSKSISAAVDYLAVAGQVVSGAKTQLERYKSLGLSVADRNLPIEASSDVENMRKTLELIVKQSKALSKNQKVSANAFALLEETSSARSDLAKDAYDAKRWKDVVADARVQIVNPNASIVDAVSNLPINSPNVNIVAVNDITPKSLPTNDNPIVKVANKDEQKISVNGRKIDLKTIAKATPKADKSDTSVFPKDRKVIVITSNKKPEKKKESNVKSIDEEKPNENNLAKNDKTVITSSPIPVGSLLGYATKRVNPVYPRQARSMRMTGTVRVEVLVDEKGKVTKIETAKGPSLLKRAARDAVKKWRFRPFERDGQPVKAKGFVSFNFNL